MTKFFNATDAMIRLDMNDGSTLGLAPRADTEIDLGELRSNIAELIENGSLVPRLDSTHAEPDVSVASSPGKVEDAILAANPPVVDDIVSDNPDCFGLPLETSTDPGLDSADAAPSKRKK